MTGKFGWLQNDMDVLAMVCQDLQRFDIGSPNTISDGFGYVIGQSGICAKMLARKMLCHSVCHDDMLQVWLPKDMIDGGMGPRLAMDIAIAAKGRRACTVGHLLQAFPTTLELLRQGIGRLDAVTVPEDHPTGLAAGQRTAFMRR